MPKPIIRLGTTSALLFGLPDDADGLVNVQQDLLKPLQQVQLFLLARAGRSRSAGATHSVPEGGPLAAESPARPSPGACRAIRTLKLQEKLSSSGVIRNSCCISLSGSMPALEIDGQLQAATDRSHPAYRQISRMLARLDQFDDLVHDGLDGGGGRDLGDLDACCSPCHRCTGPAPARCRVRCQ